MPIGTMEKAPSFVYLSQAASAALDTTASHQSNANNKWQKTIRKIELDPGVIPMKKYNCYFNCMVTYWKNRSKVKALNHRTIIVVRGQSDGSLTRHMAIATPIILSVTLGQRRLLLPIHERTASPIFHSDPSVIIKESNPATEKDRGSFTASSSAGFTPKAPSPSQWFQKLPVLGSRSQQMTSAPTQPEPQGSISQSPVEAEGDTTLQQLDKLVHSLLGFDSTTLPMIDGMEDAVQEAIAAMAGGDSRAAAEAILKGFGGIDEERDRIACDNWNVI
ncbi:hypothetical protein HII31_07076 [Pseudocercospora fuligena]|uniref:Uncharacterized protein n=1 Tax=Pseudocercospora fuligena TaxID=685502 RepID=A0A8H6RHE4_9PEZI|nr:hypothetical protein HII31_07076 [Pseudocercospora fuligena]